MREIRTHGSIGRGVETGRQVPRRPSTLPAHALMKQARGAGPLQSFSGADRFIDGMDSSYDSVGIDVPESGWNP